MYFYPLVVPDFFSSFVSYVNYLRISVSFGSSLDPIGRKCSQKTDSFVFMKNNFNGKSFFRYLSPYRCKPMSEGGRNVFDCDRMLSKTRWVAMRNGIDVSGNAIHVSDWCDVIFAIKSGVKLQCGCVQQ